MLKFNVTNQIITRLDDFVPVADSKNYLKAEFTFSNEWTGDKYAIFGHKGKPYKQLIVDNCCEVPWEVIKYPYFTLAVFCGDLITSNVLCVPIEKSGMTDGEVPGTPTPTVFEQYIKELKKTNEKALKCFEKSEYKTDILNDDGGFKDFDGNVSAYPTAQSVVKAIKQGTPFVIHLTRNGSPSSGVYSYSVTENLKDIIDATLLNKVLYASVSGDFYRIPLNYYFTSPQRTSIYINAIYNGSCYLYGYLAPGATNINMTNIHSPLAAKKDLETKADKTELENIKTAYNEAHWDSVQNGGQRRDYSYAFTKWSGTAIEPLYPIVAEKLMYTFMDCVNAADLSNISITLTGENPNMMYAFANCLLLEALSEISYDETVKAVRVMTSLYANCKKLKTAKIYFGDGSVNPVEVRNNMQNAFYKCESMENIEFSGKGSPIGLDLSPCTKLAKDSLISLSNALMDVSEAEAGAYEIKLAEESYALLTEDEIKIFSDLGWTLTV